MRTNHWPLTPYWARFALNSVRRRNSLIDARPFDNRIRARKRDALTDYLLSCRDPQFNTLDDLYNYFLLDVQLEGIMQTSWVVAAISSAQLYVYRCIMNLEQDDRAPRIPTISR